MTNIIKDNYEFLIKEARRMLKTDFFRPSLNEFLRRILDCRNNGTITQNQSREIVNIIKSWKYDIRED